MGALHLRIAGKDKFFSTIMETPVSGDMVQISVTDTGIGMSEEMAENLFQTGMNTSRKGTAGEQSTGLGLIICSDFIKKHGGKLSVTSEKGKGSAFSFTLPAKNDKTATNPVRRNSWMGMAF